jgi:FkbM family methyltransferase
MRIRAGRSLLVAGVVTLGLWTAVSIQRRGATALFLENRRCCQLPFVRNLQVTLYEIGGVRTYFSEVGQDKWVLERVFPHVTNGYFVDVGSGHGTIGSNTRTLEERGWSGVCIDPFPVHMEGRTCKMFKEVVFSKPGLIIPFHTAGGLGGVAGTLGKWNVEAARAPTVNVTTVTLGDVLARAAAPHYIHFMSVDIEGAELEALRAFPFDRYRVAAWTIEHNREEPKRSQIVALLGEHGYRRVNAWRQDDFFVPVDARY